MVCMDGFVLTHAFEQVDLPEQEKVDAFLPPFTAPQLLDPDDPVTIGAMVGPEAFAEVKYLMHAQQVAALDEIPRLAGGVPRRVRTGLRRAGAALPARGRRDRGRGARVGARHVEEVVDALRDEGVPVGALGITCFRPWPAAEVREALAGASRVVVLEKAFAVGAGGIVGQDVRDATRGLPGRGVRRGRRSRRPRRSPARRCAATSTRCSPGGWSRNGCTSSTSTTRWSSASWSAHATGSAPARTPRTCCGTWGSSGREPRRRRRRIRWASRRSSSTRPAPSRSATGCSTPSSARSRPGRVGRTR